MIDIEESVGSVKIFIPKREDINLSRLYNDDFLGLFKFNQKKQYRNTLERGAKQTGGAKKVRILKEIQNYILNFLSKSASTKKSLVEYLEDNDDVVLTIEKDNANAFVSLSSLERSENNNEYLCYENTNITYAMLFDLLSDLDIQLSYMNNLNIGVSVVNLENIYRINGRYVLLDSENIIAIDYENNKNEERNNRKERKRELVKKLTKKEEIEEYVEDLM
jgi:hypothetical protein